ncbi:hypothetical protein MINTM007_29690 [Mycobacterium intracellulare]|nr:hypothetical protein MINTM007_29690 [Mycobacterium intracellulare]
MRNQGQFDAIAREMVQGVSGVCCVLLDRDLRIRAASRAYERVALREHGELSGQYLFDAFPDNPKDPQATGTSNLASSLEIAMRAGHTHKMRLQRYDIPDPAGPRRIPAQGVEADQLPAARPWRAGGGGALREGSLREQPAPCRGGPRGRAR